MTNNMGELPAKGTSQISVPSSQLAILPNILKENGEKNIFTNDYQLNLEMHYLTEEERTLLKLIKNY